VFQRPLNQSGGTPAVVETEILEEAESLGQIGIIGSVGNVEEVAVCREGIGGGCGWRNCRGGREDGSCSRG
jgi:hypothetical protein